MTTPMLRFESVTHHYGRVLAVDSLSFEVQQGEMFGLIGPDGAGKTTTLRLALGLLRPSAGHISTCALDPLHSSRALSAKVGYLSQRFSLYGDLTVDENIAFFAEIHAVRGWRPRRDELLEMVHMLPFRSRLAERLSGGMKQKLALACTLIHTPELLILDEPTTGVDPVSRREFWKLLARLQRDGLTIVMSTPYLDEAERCQHVVLLDRGRRLISGPPASLMATVHGTMYEIIATPRRQAVELLRAVAGVEEVEIFGERLHVRCAAGTPAANLTEALTAGAVSISSLRETSPSLEDVFIASVNDTGMTQGK